MNLRALFSQNRWLTDFHAGDPTTLERCYRDHFDDVRAAVGRVLQGADRDCVVHDVFCRVIADAGLRANFRGGNLAAWLSTVSRNQAMDYRRRHAREETLRGAHEPDETAAHAEDEVDAKLFVERFRRERLPGKLEAVFDARFVRQLSQREAARALGLQRTTLAYQEQQLRDALRAFLLEER